MDLSSTTRPVSRDRRRSCTGNGKCFVQWAFVAGVALVAIAAAAPATAQAFPARPIRIISPYPPGGGNDILSRAIAQRLQAQMGGQVFVENRPGANSIIGTDLVAKSPPDGYTMILVPSSHAINQSLYPKVPYDAVRDFTPISLAGTSPMLLAVPAASPLQSVRDLVRTAQGKPGELTYSTAGSGSTGHLTAVLLEVTTGIRFQHVPFKGTAPAVTALLGSQVHMSFAPPTTFLPHIRAGKLRALGVTSAERSAVAADIPTMVEQGLPDFVSVVWYGFLGPAKLPREILQRLNAEIVAAVKDPEIRKLLSDQSIDPVSSTPEEFAKLIAADLEKWARVVKASGARVE